MATDKQVEAAITAFDVPKTSRFRQRMRAALEAAEAAAWQPIATAPRDGTRVQLFRRIGNWNVVGWGYFVPEFGGCWLGFGYNDPPGNLGLAHPTHWRPLPAPPKDTTNG